MKARPVPFSSPVGSGVMIVSDIGQVIGQLALLGFNPDPAVVERIGEADALRLTYTEMARCIADALNRDDEMQQEPPEDEGYDGCEA